MLGHAQVKVDWYELLCFGSLAAFLPSMCDFVPCDWTFQRVCYICLYVIRRRYKHVLVVLLEAA